MKVLRIRKCLIVGTRSVRRASGLLETGYPEVDWIKAAFAGSNPASFLELSLCESSAPKVVLTKAQDGPRGW
jgi:hypothetical protein